MLSVDGVLPGVLPDLVGHGLLQVDTEHVAQPQQVGEDIRDLLADMLGCRGWPQQGMAAFTVGLPTVMLRTTMPTMDPATSLATGEQALRDLVTECGQRLACPIPRSERRPADSVLASRPER